MGSGLFDPPRRVRCLWGKDKLLIINIFPLGSQGSNSAELVDAGRREEAEQALLVGLDSTIQRLEEQATESVH